MRLTKPAPNSEPDSWPAGIPSITCDDLDPVPIAIAGGIACPAVARVGLSRVMVCPRVVRLFFCV